MSGKSLIKMELFLMGRPVKSFTFDKDVIAVGRDPKSDVFVDNPGVSREHLRFELTPTGEYRVVDLGSANGTFLNDEPIKRAYVWNRDIVRFGKYTILIGLERDRRERPSDDGRRLSPTVENATVVLSTAELEHLMSQSRKREGSTPMAEVATASSPPAAETRAGNATEAPTQEAGATRRSPGALEVWGTILLGTALAVALGAGVTWLLSR